ncbi:hypothetical protein [Flectobacillus longus]|uniref:hypothetical protein n=1 Tax=Flectobacillus longus TaxID=2984207 RepID=UPI0024B7C09B|nr:hypothetical protein [Flectobacillus longus]MDI9880912.1 hypothetical protein [Flectobacillus longus]
MNFLDYLTTLTTADTRQAQGRLVKVSATTAYGLTFIFSDAKPSVITYPKGALLGRIRQTTTVVDKTTKKTVAYTAVDLDEPLLVDAVNQKYLTYLWFKPTELEFADNGEQPRADNKTELVPLYCNTTSGVKLRPEANTLKKELKIVSYGNIVGYTDKSTKKYLTITFLKVFDAKGKAIGWVASDYVSYSKPQSKALPKVDSSGESSSVIVSQDDDPQSGISDSTGAGILKVVLYGFFFLLFSLFFYSMYRAYKDKKNERKAKLV